MAQCDQVYAAAVREAERRSRRATRVLGVGLLFWLVETWYFGWNRLPESDAERVCDAVCVLLLATAAVWKVQGLVDHLRAFMLWSWRRQTGTWWP